MGDEFKNNLRKVVEEAYSHLISKVVVEKVKPESLFNYFAEHYHYGEATAKLSTRIFVFLCQEAGIPLSQELLAMEFKPEEKKKKIPEEGKGVVGRNVIVIPTGMHKIEWGDSILIYLRKGDRSTRESIAKNARMLIDMYVEEIEEERTE